MHDNYDEGIRLAYRGDTTLNKPLILKPSIPFPLVFAGHHHHQHYHAGVQDEIGSNIEPSGPYELNETEQGCLEMTLSFSWIIAHSLLYWKTMAVTVFSTEK